MKYLNLIMDFIKTARAIAELSDDSHVEKYEKGSEENDT